MASRRAELLRSIAEKLLELAALEDGGAAESPANDAAPPPPSNVAKRPRARPVPPAPYCPPVPDELTMARAARALEKLPRYRRQRSPQ